MSLIAPQSICIIRLSAIGDTCNIVPALTQIQCAFPDCKLTWIIGKTEHALLHQIANVEFIIVDKAAGKKNLAEVRRQLKSRKFDVMLHMHASMRANLVSRWVRSDRRIGFDRARARDFQWWFRNESIEAVPRTHVVDGFLSFVKALGVTPGQPEWTIPIEPAASGFAEQYTQTKTLVISPCSSDRRRNFRNWSVENYAAIADYAAQHYQLSVVLTGGPTELEKHFGEHISKLAQTPLTNLIGCTSLQQLMAILHRSTALISPDSGPAHMANAAGLPVIGLFATSNRWRTGPYNSQKFAVDRYPDAVKQYLGKTVEQLSWGKRVRAPQAMELIQRNDVTEKLDLLMRTL